MFNKKRKKKKWPGSGAVDDASAVDIPQLQKKKEEKKKGGFFWRWLRPDAAGWQGAKGAAGATGRLGVAAGQQAAGAAGRAVGSAAAAAGSRSALGALIHGMTSTLLGKAVLMGAAAIILGGGFLALRSVLSGPSDVPRTPFLEALASRIRVARGGDSTALDYARRAGDGSEIKFGKTYAEMAAEQPQETGDTGKSEPVETEELPDGGIEAGETGDTGKTEVPRLQGNNLTTSLGGSQFSGKAPKFGGTLGKAMEGFAKSSGKRASSSGQAKKVAVTADGRRGRVRGLNRDVRSLAQLRQMSGLNTRINSGGTSVSETNADAALAQFEGQSAIEGGDTPASPFDGDPPVNPDTGGGNGMSCDWETQTLVQGECVAIDGAGTDLNLTPWQPQVDAAMKMMGMIKMLIYGAVIMLLLASVWYYTVCSYAFGLPFGYIGAALAFIAAIMGYMLMEMGKQINSMGGSPEGDIFIAAGQKYMILGTLMGIIALLPAAGIAGVAAGTTAATIMLLVTAIAGGVWASLG